MLVNFERRHYKHDIKVWQGIYCDLQNIVHWHNEFELIYIRKGCAEIGVNQDAFSAQTGDLIICQGGDMHRINSKEAGTVCDIVIFDGDFLRPIFRMLSIIKPYIKKNESDKQKLNIDKFFKFISNELRNENLFAEEVIKAEFISFFVSCVRSLGYHWGKADIKSHKRDLLLSYQELLENIDKNYSEITFEKSAKLMHVTPQHFSKVFKDISGMTFTDYLNYVRIEKAVELLQTTNMYVTEISEACGFNNIRSFNRVFKMITGKTPSRIDLNFQLPMVLHPMKETEIPFDATISHSSLVIG